MTRINSTKVGFKVNLYITASVKVEVLAENAYTSIVNRTIPVYHIVLYAMML